MATFDEFISSLDRDFGPQGKGKKFEVFCKWFLQNDPQWSRVVDEVWHFEDYPDKWQTTDLGTDPNFSIGLGFELMEDGSIFVGYEDSNLTYGFPEDTSDMTSLTMGYKIRF